MGVSSLLAQEVPQERVEILVKVGSDSVEFRLEAPEGSQVKVHWGDGKSDEYPGNSEIKAYHKYASALEKVTTVTVEASALTGFTEHRWDSSIIGLGAINAPQLTKLQFNSTAHHGTLNASKGGVVDVSQCPRIQTLSLGNAPGLRLGKHPDLKFIKLYSYFDSTDEIYGQVKLEQLKLSDFPNLEEVFISEQQIALVDISGLEKLKTFAFLKNGTKQVLGLRELTKNKGFTWLFISSNKLGIDQLPLRNPDTKYILFKYPQLDYELPKQKIKGLKVDLSHLASLKGWDNAPNSTTFTWKKDGKVIPPSAYREEAGCFTFNDELFAESEEAMIYAEIVNPLFSNKELTGSNDKAYRTANITLKKGGGGIEISDKRLELLVEKGSSKVSFVLDAPAGEAIAIDWGDGKRELLEGTPGLIVEHSYSPALAGKARILVEASSLTGFAKGLYDESIVGFGRINAPLLENLVGAAHEGTLKESDNNVVDLSHCPKLRILKLLNAPAITLGKHPELSFFWLHSEGDKTHPNYAALKVEQLDLSPYSKLEKIEIYGQQIAACKLTGLMALKSLVYVQNGTSRALGLRELTTSALLTRLDITFNHIGINELPLKNPSVEYNLFDYYQKAYIIPHDKIAGAKINLQHLASVNGWDAASNTTTFTCKKGGKSVAEDAYKEENGLFTFNTNLFEAGEEEVKIRILIANPLFPNADLAAVTGTQYGAQEITLKKSETPKPGAAEGMKAEIISIALLEQGNLLLVEGLAAGESVQIFDLTGCLLLHTNEPRINISSLPHGTYIVRAANKGAKIVK